MWMAILKPKSSENTPKTFRKAQKKRQPSENNLLVRLRVCQGRHNAFVLYLALTSLGTSVLLCSSVVPSVTG